MTRSHEFPEPRVAAVASAFPPTRIDRDTSAEMIERLFPDEDPDLVRNLVERCGVETRFLVPTVAEMLAPSSFTERNAQYGDEAVRLGARAAQSAIGRAGLSPRDIDAVVDVSCTGIAIPALDVALSPALGLRDDVLRIPVTESGCAAGALGLTIAASLARGGQRVLVVAVELCSLTYVREDRSRANLVASVLFGDGAAAAVVVPSDPDAPRTGTDRGGPAIVASGSHLIQGTADIMGFHVGSHGMQIFLDRELPGLLLGRLPAVQTAFLERHGRTIGDVALHLIHPGGRRVIEAYRDIHHLDEHALRFTRESLRRYGNLSSASILTVLELALEEQRSGGLTEARGKPAYLMGVGPGLSIEMLLLRFE